jgi:hypothetical protein
MVQPDVAERRVQAMISRNVRECLRDTVEERFGTDETMIGQHIRPPCQMLAATETDLEMERAVITKQAAAGYRPFG